MMDKAIGLFCILVSVCLFAVLLGGCAPVPSENDLQVSGNLKDLQFIHRGNEYTTAVATFENKEVHVFLMYNNEHYNFQLDRINVIHYDSMNHITKIEVLE